MFYFLLKCKSKSSIVSLSKKNWGLRDMSELKCPMCNAVFQVDKSGFAEILSQVRSSEFEKDIQERTRSIEAEKKKDIILAVQETESKKTLKLWN